LNYPFYLLLLRHGERCYAERGGNETVTGCHGLKMMAHDGKMQLTDVADQEQIF